tara:strand:+ start:122 stop:493 length:372 start_codon:yes stop_codon:yes gene_type:complete
MKNENAKAPLLSRGEMESPKGLSSPLPQEVENTQSRSSAQRTIEMLQRKVQYTPEVETGKNELRRCKDGIVRGKLNNIECEIFESESQREGAVEGIKYSFIRFNNHPSIDEYGNYIKRNKIGV